MDYGVITCESLHVIRGFGSVSVRTSLVMTSTLWCTVFDVLLGFDFLRHAMPLWILRLMKCGSVPRRCVCPHGPHRQ